MCFDCLANWIGGSPGGRAKQVFGESIIGVILNFVDRVQVNIETTHRSFPHFACIGQNNWEQNSRSKTVRPNRIVMKAKSKERLDKLLVARGLVETRAKAQALILAGQVFSEQQRLDKAGTPGCD